MQCYTFHSNAAHLHTFVAERRQETGVGGYSASVVEQIF